MNPPGIVKVHIMLNSDAQLRQVDIRFDFDVLLFQRPQKRSILALSQYRLPPSRLIPMP